MKISIVVLTYNSADFVTATLESAWRQSFNGDLELIVADDCSTDDTVRICQAWIDSHRNRFCSAEVLTSPINTGVTANVDRACRKASGEWIKVIAGDDILMDDCIDKLFAGAGKFGPDCRFISAQALVFSRSEALHHPETLEIMDPVPDKDSIGLERIWQNPVFWLPAPTFMYRKDLLEQIGYFPQLFRNIEDAPFLAKIIAYGFRLFIIHTPVAYYRIHNQSLTQTELKRTSVSGEYCKIYENIIRPTLNPLQKWDAFLAYLPLRINMKKGRYSKTEKRAGKYGKYFQFSHYFKSRH